MKILIIEDEALAAEKLTLLLKRYQPPPEVLACLSSVKQTKNWLAAPAVRPDLIFMDIRLSDGLAFEVFREVEVTCPVIFTTAYDQYAIKAFKNNGVDYLLKPIDFQDLKESLHRFEERYLATSEGQMLQKMQTLFQEFQKKKYKTRFLVKSGQKLVPISTSQIAYFYKEEIVLLMTHTGHKYAVNFSLEELERNLDPQTFFRVNRQFIVHPEAIVSIHQHFKGKLKLLLEPSTKQEIIMSQERSAQFKAWLDH